MTEPAIRTQYDERYSDVQTIDQIGSDTRFHRGFGQTGSKVLLVDMENCDHQSGCPRCGEREMVLSLDLNPRDYDLAVFYCTNIACPHFVGDEIEYDMSRIRADSPHVWDNTAECPGCGTRHTVEIERNSFLHDEANDGSSCIVETACDDCAEDIVEQIKGEEA